MFHGKGAKGVGGDLAFIIAWLFLVPSLAWSQTPSANPSISPLQASISVYRAANSSSRVSAAATLERNLKRDLSASESVELQAEATILLSEFALLDRKKDLALKLAKKAETLLLGSVSPSAPRLKVGAARVKAQALLAQQDRLEALRTIIQARVSYGRPKLSGDAQWDVSWDELFLWQKITTGLLVGPERAIGLGLLTTELGNRVLLGDRDQSCDSEYDRIKRLNPELGIPYFPIVPMLSGQSGGVAMRLTLKPDGSVQDVEVTSFSPSEDFAIVAENAAREWKFSISPDVKLECLKSRLQLIEYRLL